MCIADVTVAPSRACFVNGFMRRGGTGHQDYCFSWLRPGRVLARVSPGVLYIEVVPGLALGSNCSSLSGLEGNLPLGAQQRCAFGTGRAGRRPWCRLGVEGL